MKIFLNEDKESLTDKGYQDGMPITEMFPLKTSFSIEGSLNEQAAATFILEQKLPVIQDKELELNDISKGRWTHVVHRT